jgi:hypothetical protein
MAQTTGPSRHCHSRWTELTPREHRYNDQVIAHPISDVIRHHDTGAPLMRIIRLTRRE